MVHGNVHPGSVLIAYDGRVVLADARADSADSNETDVRAVGGILYFALTGRWPHAEAGRSALPDANRDAAGAIAAPRQIRAGVPAYLDDLTMDLLDKRVAAPEADALAAELARLDAAAEEDYEEVGPLRFTQGSASEPMRGSTRKIVVGVGALVVIALIGLVFGIRAISNSGQPDPTGTTQANSQPNTNPGTAPGQDTGGQADTPKPQKIALTADMVRIVDPPDGTRDDTGEAAATVDGDKDTGWQTQGYNQPKFGNRKKGMGVLINLGSPRSVSEIRVETTDSGATMDVRAGTTDPGDTSAGDAEVVKTFKKLGESGGKMDGTNKIFTDFDAAQKYQYVMVFVTELPRGDDGKYRLTLTDIEVSGS
jgi:hypothetical protein